MMDPEKKEPESEEEIKLDEEGNPVEKVELEEEKVELDEDGNPVEIEEPFWMKEEEEQGSSKLVPEAAIINAKKKLKGQLREQDEELEQLKAENARLKQASLKPPQQTSLPKRPRIADFNEDDKYEEAMDKYEAEKLEYQSTLLNTDQTQKQQATARAQRIEERVDEHYGRATKLVEAGGIKPEVYQQADMNVKKVIDSVMPKVGEPVFNELVSLIGEGSEKTMFYLGRNKAAQNEFRGLLMDDKSGLSAALYLGRLSAKVNGTQQNKTSRAHKPAVQIQGDAATPANEAAAKKKYEAAHKKGNAGEAYKVKQAAKKQGIDTSKWS